MGRGAAGRGVPAGPIYNYDEALASEQAVAREMVLEIDHPVEGKVKALGFPVKLSGTPQQVRHPAPLLGQHTDEMLGEIRPVDAESRRCERDAFARPRCQAHVGTA
jgi:crotonobetainyl-CoA:carnitine CoA-transferase CaiB-like acyl-CoA transferase